MTRSERAFCNFCVCTICQNGAPHFYHALCEDGRWICNVCYTDADCKHRPKLRSGWWISFEEKNP